MKEKKTHHQNSSKIDGDILETEANSIADIHVRSFIRFYACTSIK